VPEPRPGSATVAESPRQRTLTGPLLIRRIRIPAKLRNLELVLLIAACAENAGLTVIHYDADFERISELTKQPVQWIVPRGSVA